MIPATPRIVLDGLTLARGDRVLVRDLSAHFEPGEFCALQGPNGAGKTTLLRAVAGFFRPAAGVIRFESEAGLSDDPHSQLHVLGHRDGLKGPLTVSAHIRYWADLLGATGAHLPDAMRRLGLERLADLPARVLSQGQARRLALARLLVAPRPVWLLDEPAAGLDKDGKAQLAALIEAHTATGGIVLAATHEPLGPRGRTVELGPARQC